MIKNLIIIALACGFAATFYGLQAWTHTPCPDDREYAPCKYVLIDDHYGPRWDYICPE